jgi:hypothetical protein
MNTHSIQLDPLNSPHPIPWNWVTSIVFSQNSVPNSYGYYRTQSLISPDQQYAAYSRIQVQLGNHFSQSRVVSVLFVENLRTGSLQSLMASSPFADNPFIVSEALDQPGTIAIVIPIAWSETGDRLLCREFESIFCTDIASDFALVWDSKTNQTQTLAPSDVPYSNAILMGWSQVMPGQVLFQAGMMGDEANWGMYAVDDHGRTSFVRGDRPVTYGEIKTHVWAGPQAGG